MLIQRLLAEGDPAYEQEFFFSTRRGTRILNLSDFRDATRNDSWDFSAFVRAYALYLDERLEYKIQDRREAKPYKTTSTKDEEREEETNDKENASKTSHFRDMKTEQIFTTLQHLQQLLERFLACRPTGAAKCHRVVTVALYQIVEESFQLYYDITEILKIYIDRFTELDIAESINAYDIFCRQGKQLDELDNFYSWCKTAGIGQTSAYPEIEKITQKKLHLIDELVRDKKSAAQQIEDGLPKAEPEAVENVNAVHVEI
ncbi:putative clathrin assembly protein [Hibiscus syriacus]|uniref:Clathrin assembly protein n=1 Tax=Hibiscus syriacus TaxID=106335 RepID=A0A6A2YJT5_HIBSY|nr:putative clathrin assembly protein [Hibiscus syriacus]